MPNAACMQTLQVWTLEAGCSVSGMLCLHVVVVAIHIIHQLIKPSVHVGWHRSRPDTLWQACTQQFRLELLACQFSSA